MSETSPHLSTGTVLALMDGELAPDAAAEATAHLEACWTCRVERDRLAAVISDIVDVKDHVLAGVDTGGMKLRFTARRRERIRVGTPGLDTDDRSVHVRGWLAGWWRTVFAGAAVAIALLLLPAGTLARLVDNVRLSWARVIEGGGEGIGANPERPRSIATDIALPSPARPVETPRPARREPPKRTLTPSDLAMLEISVLARLDGIGALIGGQVEVARTNTRIEVRGLVEDSTRRREILDALTSIPAGTVAINVRSINEELRELPPSGAIQFRPLEFDAAGIPAAVDLRAHLTTRGQDDVDAEVRRIATSSLRHSRVALRHALVMESLAERYEAQALRVLNPKAYETWRQLIGTHGTAFVDETRRLRELLEPVFVHAPPPLDLTAQPQEIADMNTAVPQLVRLAVAIDDVVREGLTTSTVRVERVQVREATFWETVRQAERLGRALTK